MLLFKKRLFYNRTCLPVRKMDQIGERRCKAFVRELRDLPWDIRHDRFHQINTSPSFVCVAIEIHSDTSRTTAIPQLHPTFKISNLASWPRSEQFVSTSVGLCWLVDVVCVSNTKCTPEVKPDLGSHDQEGDGT